VKKTFKKAERLTGKTRIDHLFSTGESFFCYPFRVVFMPSDASQVCPCRVLITVPKRLHKTAVSRNLLKRRTREAYRLSKAAFYQRLGDKKIMMALLYSDKKVLDYKTIQDGVKVLENRVLDQIK